MKTIVISESHGLRLRTEEFIKDVYAKEYNAKLNLFPSKLIAMLDGQGDILCAAALRSSDDGFFSECYLSTPIESLLAEAVQERVERQTIFEVSTFASRAPNSTIRFVSEIVAYGKAAGFDWAFFTLTARLQLLLDRIGLALIPLTSADISRVEDPASWGSYYEMSPKVYAVAGLSFTGLSNSPLQTTVHA